MLQYIISLMIPQAIHDAAKLGIGGGERTEVQFRDLLHQAGFVLTRVIPATGMRSIVEAQPV